MNDPKLNDNNSLLPDALNSSDNAIVKDASNPSDAIKQPEGDNLNVNPVPISETDGLNTNLQTEENSSGKLSAFKKMKNGYARFKVAYNRFPYLYTMLIAWSFIIIIVGICIAAGVKLI